MKITCIIPTRGDRPQFIEQALKQIDRQTRKPDDVKIIESENGITGNVRTGYNLVKEGVVQIWEDDDLYFPEYLETLEKNFKGDITGFGETIYYHIGRRKYKHMAHQTRASLFQTAIKAGLKIKWPDDSVAFLDQILWDMVRDGKIEGTIIPGYKAIGIKHGIGKHGGRGHLEEFPYQNDDQEMKFLNRYTEDPFYFDLSQKLKRA